MARAEDPPKIPFVFLISEAEGLSAALRGSWYCIDTNWNMKLNR